AQAEALGGACDAAGDLAAIGDQNGAEHGGRTLAAARRRVSGRDACRTYCGGPNGASGPAPLETKFAAGAGAVTAACAGGAGGAGVHTGSGCSTGAVGAGDVFGACAGRLAACLRDFFDGGTDAVAAAAAGFAVAADAGAGVGLVPGSG